MKILIVDDSLTMRKILSKAFADMNITEIDEAGDGQQCINKLAANKYDCVLMDWNMPNMSGYEALTQLREAGHTVPVIMVTTEAEKQNVIEALKAGANNYVVKPFQKETLLAKFQQTMEKAAGE